MYPLIKLSHPEDFNLEAAVPLHRHLWMHAEQYQQRRWGRKSHACGTIGCVAGWAVMLSDIKTQMDYQHLHIAGKQYLGHDTPGDIPGAARKILGLSLYEADKLFLALLPAFIARLRLGSMIRQAKRYHKGVARAEQARQDEIDRQAAIQVRKAQWEELGQNYVEEFDAAWESARDTETRVNHRQ